MHISCKYCARNVTKPRTEVRDTAGRVRLSDDW